MFQALEDRDDSNIFCIRPVPHRKSSVRGAHGRWRSLLSRNQASQGEESAGTTENADKLFIDRLPLQCQLQEPAGTVTQCLAELGRKRMAGIADLDRFLRCAEERWFGQRPCRISIGTVKFE